MNLIQDNPVTTENIPLVEEIYGKDIALLKGKTTQARLQAVKSYIIELPPKLIRLNFSVTLSIDIMTIKSCEFLTTINNNIYYQSTILPRK